MGWQSFAEVPKGGIKDFMNKFGAAHLSKVCSPVWHHMYADKKASIAQAGGMKDFLCVHQGHRSYYTDYLSNFLMPLWMELRREYDMAKAELCNSIASGVGFSNPTQGLSRALFTLTNHRIEGANAQPKRLPRRDESVQIVAVTLAARGTSAKSRPSTPRTASKVILV